MNTNFTTTTNVNIKTTPFYKDLVKFTLTTTTANDTGIYETVKESITTETQVGEVIKNFTTTREPIDITSIVEVPWMYNGIGYLVMVTLEDLESLLRHKFLYTGKIVKPYNKDEYNPNIHRLLIYNLYTGELADLDKNMIPLPITVNDREIDDYKYNLPKLLNIIKESNVPIWSNTENDPYKIHKLKFYKATEFRHNYLSFSFTPSVQAYEAWNNIKYNAPCDMYTFLFHYTFDVKDAYNLQDFDTLYGNIYPRNS